MMTIEIDVARDFSRKPFGRDENDGKFSGKRFRDEYLIPTLIEHPNEKLVIALDGVERGYGSSFLEEAFAGLLRNNVAYATITNLIEIKTQNTDYYEEIWEYIEEQRLRNSDANT